MGAALLCSASSADEPAFSEVDATAFQSLDRDVRQLLDDVRRQRPVEGTPEETESLTALFRLGCSTWRLLGPSLLRWMRAGVDSALGELVRKELVAAEAERKLALRHLEQAVHRYAVLVEAVARPLAELDRAETAALLEDLGSELEAAGVSLEGEDRIVLRFQLDVLVALQVLDAPLDELTYWAFRAITNARRVEAMPAAAVARLLAGEVARARARRAWVGWDESELEKELAPWPDASR